MSVKIKVENQLHLLYILLQTLYIIVIIEKI